MVNGHFNFSLNLAYSTHLFVSIISRSLLSITPSTSFSRINGPKSLRATRGSNSHYYLRSLYMDRIALAIVIAVMFGLVALDSGSATGM
jgi:hypothetical protein